MLLLLIFLHLLCNFEHLADLGKLFFVKVVDSINDPLLMCLDGGGVGAHGEDALAVAHSALDTATLGTAIVGRKHASRPLRGLLVECLQILGVDV